MAGASVFNFLIASSAELQYSQSTHSVVLIEAFLMRELGGVSVMPQRKTREAATASARRKIAPIL